MTQLKTFQRKQASVLAMLFLTDWFFSMIKEFYVKNALIHYKTRQKED